MYKIFWTSEDKQGDVLMGVFSTRAEAEANLAAAKAELLSEAIKDEEQDQKGLMTETAVKAGSWAVIEESEEV